ncbi:MAG TPA: hypothetical protein VNL17_04535 [Verrucomicrobiae bacterium]|nr:hypothetical protein [Verrucomicrobiae bacterium]
MFTIMSAEHDKSHRGNASQFFVAGELCRRGYAAVVTMGNTPNTDVLCSNRAGTKFVHIQVKTFVPGSMTCSVGRKAERDFGPHFFWILGGIPLPSSSGAFEYFIIPASDMARNVSEFHARWLSGVGKNGQVRRDSAVRAVGVGSKRYAYFWNVASYHDRWDFISQQLDS